jgi:single-strand DNA-binding protein
MNITIIKGRLVADPEMRNTAGGKNVVNFKVAVNRRFKKDTADFFDCIAWGPTADFIFKYFNKGKEILCNGEMNCRKWQDKEGKDRYSWELNVSEVDFCGSNGNTRSESEQPTYAPSESGFEEVKDDDLPFM